MKKITTAAIANTISAKRKTKGLTQAELARVTGINRSMIGRIENEDILLPLINCRSLQRFWILI